jgi:branched-chain amino acid transport system ATP-binding protein
VTATHLRMLGAVAGYTPTIPVLQGIDLEVAPERCTVVLGPNGSGKSTILRVLYGLLDLQEGEIRLGDQRIDGTPTHRLLEVGVAFLPQGRSVFPQLTVDENLRVGGWIFGRDVHRLEEALDRVYAQYPLLANMSQAPAGSLSGGQQRMLEIARMVLTDPQVLLIDEPSAGLAPNLVDEVYVEIERLKADGKTVLLVDQNVEAAIGLADHVYIVEYGKVKAEGQVDDFAGDVAGIVREWLRV